MQVFEAVKTLLAVRSYQDTSVPEDVIRKIVEAARLTASSRNKQDWDFILIADESRLRELGELARTGRYIAEAAFAIAVVTGDYGSAAADAGRAIQDMMLVAWEDGVGSNWVGNVKTDEIRAFLGVPGERIVQAIVPFGYPAEELGQGVKDRKPLAQVAHRDRFGTPLDI